MQKEKLTGIRIKFDNKPLSEQEQKETKGWAVPKEQCTYIAKDSNVHPKIEFGDFFLFIPDKAKKIWMTIKYRVHKKRIKGDNNDYEAD